MNPLRLCLLILALGFVCLLPKPRWAFTYGRWVLLAIAAASVLAPFAWLVAAAFKDRSVFNEYVFFPPLSEWSSKTLNLNNFRELLTGKSSVRGTVYFYRYVLNSVFYASVSTCLQVFLASLTGYALAKYDFRFKTGLMLFMLGSMMMPGVLLLAPVYKLAVDTHLIDSLWGLILPGIVTAYGIFLFRQSMIGVPDEIIDAGRIDGCSELSIYARLVMPLVRPMTAAFALISFLQNWNAFFAPNVFLHSQDKLTLPIILNLYLSQYENNYGVFLAGTLLAIIPPAALFLALQKEFISGLVSGAVKG